MAQTSIKSYVVRHPFLMKAVLLAAGSAALLVFATLPFFQNASDMTKKIRSRRTEAKELAEKVTILSGLDQAVLDQRVTVLDHALPPRKDVVLYLSTIDGLSRELSLNFGGISLSPGEVTEASGSAAKAAKAQASKFGLQSLETDIKITGSQENIYSFLRSLEESAPLMQIKDAKVSAQSGDTYSLSLRLGMLWAATDIQQIKGPIALFDSEEEKYFAQLSQFRSFNSQFDAGVIDTGLGKTNIFESPAELTPQQ